MIHNSVTRDLIREWCGTDDEVAYYEYTISPSPSGPDEFVETLAREAAGHSARQKGLALVGEPLMFRHGERNELRVVWRHE